MKKFLLFAVAAIAFSTLSQAQMKIGIQAGGTLSEPRVNVSKGSSLYTNNKSQSYQAGLIAEFEVFKNIYVQPQLLYTRRYSTLLSSTGAGNTRVRINYAELPVNLVYKVELPFGKLFAGGGISYSYGFSGTEEQSGVRRKIYSNVKTWKHSDVNANILAGFELNNGLFVRANTQKGLMNVSKIDGTSIKNRSVSVTVGYLADLN